MVLGHGADIAERQQAQSPLSVEAEGQPQTVGAHPRDAQIVDIDTLQGIVGERHPVVVVMEPLHRLMALAVDFHKPIVVGGKKNVARLVLGHIAHHISRNAFPGASTPVAHRELLGRAYPQVALRVDEDLVVVVFPICVLFHKIARKKPLPAGQAIHGNPTVLIADGQPFSLGANVGDMVSSCSSIHNFGGLVGRHIIIIDLIAAVDDPQIALRVGAHTPHATRHAVVSHPSLYVIVEGLGQWTVKAISAASPYPEFSVGHLRDLLNHIVGQAQRVAWTGIVAADGETIIAVEPKRRAHPKETARTLDHAVHAIVGKSSLITDVEKLECRVKRPHWQADSKEKRKDEESLENDQIHNFRRFLYKALAGEVDSTKSLTIANLHKIT